MADVIDIPDTTRKINQLIKQVEAKAGRMDSEKVTDVGVLRSVLNDKNIHNAMYALFSGIPMSQWPFICLLMICYTAVLQKGE